MRRKHKIEHGAQQEGKNADFNRIDLPIAKFERQRRLAGKNRPKQRNKRIAEDKNQNKNGGFHKKFYVSKVNISFI